MHCLGELLTRSALLDTHPKKSLLIVQHPSSRVSIRQRLSALGHRCRFESRRGPGLLRTICQALPQESVLARVVERVDEVGRKTWLCRKMRD